MTEDFVADVLRRRISCDVYWGSHGCEYEQGHVERDGTPHTCDCCTCEDHERDYEEEGCVAKPPYYGKDTKFYGDDVPETPIYVMSEEQSCPDPAPPTTKSAENVPTRVISTPNWVITLAESVEPTSVNAPNTYPKDNS